MVNQLKSSLASYRILYFQPDPEDGDRIAVAILVYHERDIEILYDRKFPKLRHLAPGIEPELVSFYLEDLRRTLTKVDSEIDERLRQHAPQLVASEERKLAWPLSEKAKLYLIERFLQPRRKLAAGGRVVDILEQRLVTSKERIAGLIEQFKGPKVLAIQRNATSEWIVGRRIPQVKPVALALRKRDETVLVDGVDLNVLSPGGALSKVNRVVHTFWQYARLRQQRLDGSKLVRIGVVLNGVPMKGSAATDAHDFALNQFAKEAELAVDASSTSDRERLREALT